MKIKRMNNVRKFTVNSPSILSIRAFMENGEPWFCSADICRVFGITQPYKAWESLDKEDKCKRRIDSCGTAYNCVNEWGIYQMIISFESKKSEREVKFIRDWIRNDIIPALKGEFPTASENTSKVDVSFNYSLKPKTFFGNPVFIAEDIAFILGSGVETVRWLIQHHGIKGYTISDGSVKVFKKENGINQIDLPKNTSIDLYLKDDVRILLEAYKPDDCSRFAEKFFEEGDPSESVKTAIHQANILLILAEEWEDGPKEGFYHLIEDLMVQAGAWTEQVVSFCNKYGWNEELSKGLSVAVSMIE
ncbi:Bro-N domain-containing protein [Peptococcus simiae]|uniref:Bro-N domain-containing protein n=1 Tax=Peptococcus simiae TaxID=1643805 RepID=A0ABW9H0G2_9FIRM